MKFDDKTKKAIKATKKYKWLIAIFWIVLTIVLACPLAYAIENAKVDGQVKGSRLLTAITNMLTTTDVSLNQMTVTAKDTSIGGGVKWLEAWKHCLTAKYFFTFLKTWLIMTIIYAAALIKGILKSKPKHNYEKVEHGSSGWSEKGEQYKILSRDSGIILAENNFLPLTKMGNLNLMIVGRFGVW